MAKRIFRYAYSSSHWLSWKTRSTHHVFKSSHSRQTNFIFYPLRRKKFTMKRKQFSPNIVLPIAQMQWASSDRVRSGEDCEKTAAAPRVSQAKPCISEQGIPFPLTYPSGSQRNVNMAFAEVMVKKSVCLLKNLWHPASFRDDVKEIFLGLASCLVQDTWVYLYICISVSREREGGVEREGDRVSCAAGCFSI